METIYRNTTIQSNNESKRIEKTKIFKTTNGFLSYFVLVLILIFNTASKASSPETIIYKTNIYKAFTNNRMDLWLQTINSMKKTYSETKNIDVLHDLTMAEYGYIAYLIGNKMENTADDRLKHAIEYAETLISSHKYKSEGKAFIGAFYGYKIGIKPIRGAGLGPKSLRAIDEAIEINPNNHTGYIEKANALFYMPQAFGGSKELALLYYIKAVKIMESKGYDSKKCWYYLNSLISLAKAYQEIGNTNLAKSVYEKILRIEPELLWVKEELYPQISEN